MKINRKRIFVGAIVLASVVGALCSAVRFRVGQFQGDGTISDSGVFTYPRYHIRLHAIPLSQVGEYSSVVSGLPSSPMHLRLECARLLQSQKDVLDGLSTRVKAQIVEDPDKSSKVLCTVDGRPVDATSGHPNGWILSVSNSSASYWNRGCLDLPISHSHAYSIRVSIEEVDRRSPDIQVIPILEGGGIELP